MVATAGSRKRTNDAAPEQVEPTARHLAVRRHDIPSAATGFVQGRNIPEETHQ